MSKYESNFTQEITLPSLGLLNPEIPEGKLVQRCMMVADQKFLSGSNHSPGSTLQGLLSRTITSPEGFDVSNLTVPDTLFLLFKLRILSYGNEYTFKTRCPECGNRIEVTLDLSELPVTTLREDYEKDLVVTLPHRGDTVYTRVLTNEDLDEINKEVKRRKKRHPEDDSEYTLRIAQSIEKIHLADTNEDITRPTEIEEYINALTDLDASTIIATRDSIAYGVAPTVEYVCPECREYIDIDVHFSGDFFRPNLTRK